MPMANVTAAIRFITSGTNDITKLSTEMKKFNNTIDENIHLEKEYSDALENRAEKEKNFREEHAINLEIEKRGADMAKTKVQNADERANAEMRAALAVHQSRLAGEGAAKVEKQLAEVNRETVMVLAEKKLSVEQATDVEIASARKVAIERIKTRQEERQAFIEHKTELESRKKAEQDAKATLDAIDKVEKQRNKDLNEQATLLGRIQAQELRLARLRKKNAVPAYTKSLEGDTHDKKMAYGKERVEVLKKEADATEMVNKGLGRQRQTIMQLSISLFVMLITIRQVVETLDQATANWAWMNEIVKEVGDTFIKVMPIMQIAVAVLQMVNIEMTVLTARVSVVLALFASLVFFYKAITTESWKMKVVFGVLGIASAALAGYLFLVKTEIAIIQSLMKQDLGASVWVTTIGVMAASAAGLAASVAIISKMRGAQTYPGESRMFTTGGVARVHAGEEIARPTIGYKSSPGMIINITGSTNPDRRMLEKLGKTIRRSV